MKRIFTLALLALALLPLAAQAQLYGVSLNGYSNGNPGPSSLYEIDPATGAGTLIGDIGYPVNSIAVDPTTGILYGAEAQWQDAGFLGRLLEIDPVTGAGTPVGDFGEIYCCRALTFDSSGQLWGWTENSDDPVTIDKSTGLATTVGNSGLSTEGQVMAFDASDVLWLIQGTSVYIIDQLSGAANSQGGLGFDPGAGGAAFDTSEILWAPRDNGRTQDSWIRITDIDGDTFEDIDTDVEYLNALTWGETGDVVLGTARFRVTKTFSDGRDDEVDVHLSCNSGLPLEQDFTIEGGGDGVLFVVTELEGTDTVCEVTESGGPDGYTPVFNNGAGCEWTGVIGGLRNCRITNEADPATFTVNKEWVIEGAVRHEVIEQVGVTIICNNPIEGGYYTGIDYRWSETVYGDDSVSVSVDTTERSAECQAWEDVLSQSGIESSDDCGVRTIPAGGSSSCTFTNTVFFEGIPTLSQYGMAIMALLMLGVGFVGLRRFV